MSQHKEDEPTDKEEKNELLPLNCRVSELTLACGCLKWGQEKHFYRMDFLESHASLFHAVRSVVKSWRKAAEYNRGKHLEVKKSDGSPWEKDVVKEYFSILKDKKEDKDTVTRQHSKSICRSVHSKHLMSKSRSVIFRKQRKPDLEELPPSCLFPYLVLIKNCVPLPLSILQRLCLSGEILCKIQYFSRKHRKKKEVTLPESERRVPKPQTETEVKYVTFDSLKELQWMLFKGLVKRKPKTVGMWREPVYSFGIQCVAPVKKAEYILPLIPKDWIIDDSLKFSEEMTHLLLQYDPRS
ncbi:uncharacterized protein LOC121923118 [Sceloporus undulatus]|uniref:uncharacterized protein LOC121923118 n=1 Tax=Sceloporus undulatus TaxID=8520 RepID=UPI001C4C8742|nr:uncharacterized protein LOC121923118 [Sceloporus undulatus]XP_042309187.1 uncharacterized protein LOC121923118 [Sceloporus undulatus]